MGRARARIPPSACACKARTSRTSASAWRARATAGHRDAGVRTLTRRAFDELDAGAGTVCAEPEPRRPQCAGVATRRATHRVADDAAREFFAASERSEREIMQQANDALARFGSSYGARDGAGGVGADPLRGRHARARARRARLRRRYCGVRAASDPTAYPVASPWFSPSGTDAKARTPSANARRAGTPLRRRRGHLDALAVRIPRAVRIAERVPRSAQHDPAFGAGRVDGERTRRVVACLWFWPRFK